MQQKNVVLLLFGQLPISHQINPILHTAVGEFVAALFEKGLGFEDIR